MSNKSPEDQPLTQGQPEPQPQQANGQPHVPSTTQPGPAQSQPQGEVQQNSTPGTQSEPVADRALVSADPNQESASAASTSGPASVQGLPDIENPYMLSSEVDRARLVAQTRLFRQYIEQNVQRFIGTDVKAVLDVGCGEGQLTQIFARLYPKARVVGVDKDEKAIDAARRDVKGLPNLTFEVGDIQEWLPAGPFDLIYTSMVLFHVPNTEKVLKLAYEALKPGGYFWSKDLDVSVMPIPGHPIFLRMGELFLPVHKMLGGHATISQELPGLLRQSGFSQVATEQEVYPFGYNSPAGRLVMAVNLGAFYNARHILSKANQMPLTEIEKFYREACDTLLAPNAPTGQYRYANTVGRRPV